MSEKFNSPERARANEGEVKSLEIANVGAVEYRESFLELSTASRQKYGLEELEGFKIKKVLSFPPHLEERFDLVEREVKAQYGDLRLSQTGGEPEKVLAVVKAMAAFTDEFHEKVVPSKDLMDDLFRIEYELTEGRTPAWGTAQHSVGADSLWDPSREELMMSQIERINNWRRTSILFFPYQKNQYSTYDIIDGKLKESFSEENTATPSPVRRDSMFLAEAARYDLHSLPLIFSYGNKNKAFVNYLTRLLESSDPVVQQSLEHEVFPNETTFRDNGFEDQERIMTLMSSIPVEDTAYRTAATASYPPTIFTDPNRGPKKFVPRPKTSREVVQCLLERKPMGYVDNAMIPIFQGGPFGIFRMGAMSEAIINMPDKTVILPISR